MSVFCTQDLGSVSVLLRLVSVSVDLCVGVDGDGVVEQESKIGNDQAAAVVPLGRKLLIEPL